MSITLVEALRKFVENAGRPVSSTEIREALESLYPGAWRSSTLYPTLYSCTVNQPKAYLHYPTVPKFLFRNADGTLEMYSESKHGPNEWAPISDSEAVEDVDVFIESSITLERNLENHLAQHLDQIEKGLTLVGRQYVTDAGRIDILALDTEGRRVPIEVKVGRATDAAIGQISRYMGWFSRTDGKPPKGILIAGDFPDELRYTLSAVQGLSLLIYRLSFGFKRIE